MNSSDVSSRNVRRLPVVAVVETFLLEAVNGTLNVYDQIPEELQLCKSDINTTE